MNRHCSKNQSSICQLHLQAKQVKTQLIKSNCVTHKLQCWPVESHSLENDKIWIYFSFT